MNLTGYCCIYNKSIFNMQNSIGIGQKQRNETKKNVYTFRRIVKCVDTKQTRKKHISKINKWIGL